MKKMKYFYIEPEVAGELGENTVLDTTLFPPQVEKLHYKFSGWLGDALLESFPCVIATESLAEAIEKSEVVGANFSGVEVTASDEFRNFYSTKELPAFKWLKVGGIAGKDDFGIAQDFRLVISEVALKILKQFGITNAHIEPFV